MELPLFLYDATGPGQCQRLKDPTRWGFVKATFSLSVWWTCVPGSLLHLCRFSSGTYGRNLFEGGYVPFEANGSDLAKLKELR